MSERLVDRVNFAKVVTVLAILFGISLGLCGVTFAIANSVRGGGGDFLLPMGILEIVVMACSAIGLVITVIVWVIASIFGGAGSGRGSEGPQKLFDEADDAMHKDEK